MHFRREGDSAELEQTWRELEIDVPLKVVRYEGHTPQALQRIEAEMMAALRAVKPDSQFAKAAH